MVSHTRPNFSISITTDVSETTRVGITIGLTRENELTGLIVEREKRANGPATAKRIPSSSSSEALESGGRA